MVIGVAADGEQRWMRQVVTFEVFDDLAPSDRCRGLGMEQHAGAHADEQEKVDVAAE